MKNGMVNATKETEGMERQAVLVIIPTEGGHFTYLCYAWGMSDGKKFLETTELNRVELEGELSFIVQVPRPGMTYNLDGSQRELLEIEKAVVLQ
jgi:hypothetical protein